MSQSSIKPYLLFDFDRHPRGFYYLFVRSATFTPPELNGAGRVLAELRNESSIRKGAVDAFPAFAPFIGDLERRLPGGEWNLRPCGDDLYPVRRWNKLSVIDLRLACAPRVEQDAEEWGLQIFDRSAWPVRRLIRRFLTRRPYVAIDDAVAQALGSQR